MPPRPPRPPFDLLRFCSWLVALIVGTVLFIMIFGVVACFAGVAIGRLPPGHCLESGLGDLVHEWWSELITLILALLVARQPPPPAPPPDDDEVT